MVEAQTQFDILPILDLTLYLFWITSMATLRRFHLELSLNGCLILRFKSSLT